VDFKLENVLVALHSLKTMDLGPFREVDIKEFSYSCYKEVDIDVSL
jgi:hypothetical protein